MGQTDLPEPKLSFAASTPPSGPERNVRFFDLPRTVQARFVAATRAALFASPRGNAHIAIRSVFAASCVFLSCLILAVGFGDAESTFTILGWKPAAAVALLVSSAVYAECSAFLARRTLRGLPFVPGTYVLHLGVAVAHSAEIKVYPWSLIARIEQQGAKIAFIIGESALLAVRTESEDVAVKLADVITRTRNEIAQLFAVAPERAAARFDPFHCGTLSSPLGPQEPLRPLPRLVGPREYAVLGLAALAVSLASVTVRNLASDAVMWGRAAKAGTAASWRAYVAAGGRQWNLVVGDELPRAELRELEPLHDLDAMLRFAKTHRDTAVEAEVKLAVQRALLGELAKVKQAGTVAAIDAFTAHYPTGPIATEVSAARHGIFVRALEHYRVLAGSPAAYAAADRLVRYTEKHGPNVSVRSLIRASASLEAADNQVKKSRLFQGEATLPRNWLSPDAQVERTYPAVTALAKELSLAFPKDVLAPTVDAPIHEDDSVDGPVVFVGYSVEWSHVSLASTAPKGVFVGVDIPVTVGVRMPGTADDVVLHHTVRRAPEAWRFAKERSPAAGVREGKVYAQMLDKSFATVAQETQGVWLKGAPAAAAQ